MEFLLRSILLILWVTLFVILFFGFRQSPVKKELEKILERPVFQNIYAYTGADKISKLIKDDIYQVYVPNSLDNTVAVIDPRTYKVINAFITGKNPQHITPSYDLKTLYVLNNLGNSLTPIEAKTGKVLKRIPVYDPYNLYFTPDGRYAMVVAEAAKRIDFRDPHTMKLIETLPVKCKGMNHLDFTVDGNYAVVSCEFSGEIVKLDIKNRKVLNYLSLNNCTQKHSMPQDVRLSPDGRTFYIADMMLDGVFLVDAEKFRVLGFIATGKGTHSIYPNREGTLFFVGNRGCHSNITCPKHGPGSIAVIDPKVQRVIAIWPIPGGGSPDMGNITPDGKELWLSGRYDREVYVFDTTTGKLTHRIPVGIGPHGLTIWPQPGRYSLGHTGNMR